MVVGVLAFQGDFAEHIALLKNMQVQAMEIRSLEDLRNVQKLIIPGGESTVIGRFLTLSGMGKEITIRVHAGTLSIFGTCAGAILLAKHVTGNGAPPTLDLMDITVHRNAYGSQAQSFATHLHIQGIKNPIAAAFIRAPIITHVDTHVEVLASHDGNPVLVRQGMLLAGTFHPEVREETSVHQLFLEMETEGAERC